MDEENLIKPATNPFVTLVRQKDKLKVLIVVFALTALLSGLFGLQTTVGPSPHDLAQAQVNIPMAYTTQLSAGCSRVQSSRGGTLWDNVPVAVDWCTGCW